MTSPTNDQSKSKSCGLKSSPASAHETLPNSKQIAPRLNWSSWLNRYWFVAIPAILLNGVLTIDHVLAKNNEKTYTVTINESVLAATRKQDDQTTLTESLQSHWIVANQQGNIEGRISAIDAIESKAVPIEQLDITLLKKGEKIRTGVTGDNGNFILEDVEPGVYTLVAAGQNGFLAYGVHVLPRPEQFENLDVNAQLDSSSPNYLEAHRAYYVSHFGVPEEAPLLEDLQIDAAAIPPEFTTLESILQNYVPAALGVAGGTDQNDVKAIAKATMIRGGFQFPLDDDGNFNGRVQPIATESGEVTELSEMNLFLIQDDVQMNQVAIEPNGKFVVEDVSPGVYSMVAAGRDGFAALSIELIGPPQNDGATIGGINDIGANRQPSAHYVSTHGKPLKANPSLGIAIVTDAKDLQFIRKEVQRVNAMRQQVAQQPFRNQPFNGEQGFAQGGAAPGGFAPSASPGFAPPSFSGGPGFTGAPPFSGVGGGRFGGGRLLPIGLIATAIAVPLATRSPADPVVESPHTTVALSPNTNSQ